MAEFVFGLGSREKTEYILEKMKKAAGCGRRVIIIVPEQQALDWDRRCAKNLPGEAALLTETVSFTRLCDSVFRRYGGCAKNYITDAEKTLVMWNAVVSVADKLRVFGNLEREDRYVSLLLSAVREMKLYSVTPEALQDAADEMEKSGKSPALIDRLRDISLIYSAYDVMLHASYDDPEESPDALCRVLSEHDYFGDSAVFIDSFYTLTPKEMKIVGEIFRRTGDVTITFPITQKSAGREADFAHTNHIRDFARETARLAARCGREVTAREISDTVLPPFELLRRGLWDYGTKPLSDSGDSISIIKCSDRYDEAKLCAAVILGLASRGASYSDIAVCCADASTLHGIIDTAFDEAGIPYYMSEKTSVTSYPALRLLLFAANVCAGGWRRDDVVSFAKTGLCGITPDMLDAFDKYTEKWHIRSKKAFCREDGWDMNPDGYVEKEATSRWGREMLRLANSAREQIIPPLEAFSESFPGSVRDISAAAYKLLCDFDVPEKLRKTAEAQNAEGRAADAQKTCQVWDAMCKILDTLALTLPDATVDAARFASLLRKTADTCTIGSIPDGINRVVVGSAGMTRTTDVRHMIIPGCVAGEFPRAPSDSGFFTDSDKEALGEYGIKLSGDVDHRMSEELFRFYSAATAPCETLTLLVPLSGGASPSAGVSRITSLLPDAPVYDFSRRSAAGELWRFAEARSERVCGERPHREDIPLCADGEMLEKATADALFGDILPMTQSRLEAFNDCAFFYYCRYILRLDEGQDAKISPADVGNFVHKILEQFMRETSADGFPVDDGVIVSRSDRLIRDYIAAVCPPNMPGRVDYLFSRLRRSVLLFARSLNEEFSQSEFTPYGFETPVGFDRSLPAPEIPLSDKGRVMTMRGIIDRLDILRRDDSIYVRVADYKTGAKSFSLADVLAGRNVQLLLYLFSVCSSPADCDFRKTLAPDGEKLVPAGAVYFSARPGEAKSDSLTGGEEAYSLAMSGISRQGLILNDKDIVSAMDKYILGRYIPVKTDKNGEIAVKQSSVASAEEFSAISTALRKSLGEIGDGVVSGDARSLPHCHGSRLPCAYCAMKCICRHTGGAAPENGNRVKEADGNE